MKRLPIFFFNIENISGDITFILTVSKTAQTEELKLIILENFVTLTVKKGHFDTYMIRCGLL